MVDHYTKIVCANCGKSLDSAPKCAKCPTRYCDRVCQVADWPRHKHICHDRIVCSEDSMVKISERVIPILKLKCDEIMALTAANHGKKLITARINHQRVRDTLTLVEIEAVPVSSHAKTNRRDSSCYKLDEYILYVSIYTERNELAFEMEVPMSKIVLAEQP